MPMLAAHICGSAYIRSQMPPRSTTIYCRRSGVINHANVGLPGCTTVVCMVDGLTSPKGQGFKVAISGADEPSLVLLFLFTIFIIGFRTGETHVTFIDQFSQKHCRTRHIRSVRRLRLPPHMNCSASIRVISLAALLRSPAPFPAAGGFFSRRPVITYTALPLCQGSRTNLTFLTCRRSISWSGSSTKYG
jgi:hypothetical protein